MTRVQRSLFTVLIFGVAAAADAQVYQINLTDSAAGSTAILPGTSASTLTAAHVDGLDSSTFDTWNNLSLDPPDDPNITGHNIFAGTTLVDAENGVGGPLFLYSQGDTNVDFDNPDVSSARDAANPGPITGPPDNVLYDHVWFARPEEFAQAFHISDLPADKYAVYVYHKDSTQLTRSYGLSFAADTDFVSSMADGTMVEAVAGNDDEAFVNGLNYTRFDIDIAANENLVVFVNAAIGENASFPSIGALQIVSATELPQLGDADGNGIIDLADFALIRDNFFSDGSNPVGTHGGEAIGALDGKVDILDFAVWKRAFKEAGGSVAGLSLTAPSVPEPASVALLAFGVAALGCQFRQRRLAAGHS